MERYDDFKTAKDSEVKMMNVEYSKLNKVSALQGDFTPNNSSEIQPTPPISTPPTLSPINAPGNETIARKPVKGNLLLMYLILSLVDNNTNTCGN